MDKILKDFACIPTQDKARCDFENPSQELVDAFYDAYMDVRQGKSCTRTNTSCKKQMTEEINTAYDNKANVLIETTGKKIPIDYVNQFVGYNVVFVYSIVSIENLVERNAKRANTKFQEYIKDTAENPAPRVVDVSEKTFNQKVKEIVNKIGRAHV